MKASDPAWLDVKPWRPVQAPLKGSPEARSARVLEDVLRQFDVVNTERYQPDKLRTWCNIYVWDATTALGCEIPHWYDLKTGAAQPVGKGYEMSANRMVNWLTDKRDGWRPCTPDDGKARAGFGFPVVLAWKNPTGASGHVAILLPDGTIAQAGRKCLWRAPVSKGFGRINPLYFTHD